MEKLFFLEEFMTSAPKPLFCEQKLLSEQINVTLFRFIQGLVRAFMKAELFSALNTIPCVCGD
jgi:hypothetical protein